MGGRIVVAWLLIAVAGSAARADEADERLARGEFAGAQREFDLRHSQRALEGYQRAYQLTPYPAILYRVAVCQELVGRAVDAVATYRRYLEVDPQSPRRRTVEERIAALTAAPPPAPSSPELPRAALGLGAGGLAIVAAAIACDVIAAQAAADIRDATRNQQTSELTTLTHNGNDCGVNSPIHLKSTPETLTTACHAAS